MWCHCFVPTRAQSQNISSLTNGPNASPKEDATLGWDNLVPTVNFRLDNEDHPSLMIHLPIQHLQSKERRKSLFLTLPSSSFGTFPTQSKLVPTLSLDHGLSQFGTVVRVCFDNKI